ncbi:PREDICTED: uncharacterized protein LOC109207629 [Nicotiana attenuata]|uniref:Viral late gene transcription factor 3 zinc ribbon domain-containing protein n=1 Tax=Nicotiana attenuata TaxID=49451 RepID=A0A314KRY6_NICAT|nr:PREDICTED: uncharacterized protein LOC109207629 [Nicotiana attenuata]OIT32221.1 hypothetical protein A4A49_09193 [Nicotiana attenuata]
MEGVAPVFRPVVHSFHRSSNAKPMFNLYAFPLNKQSHHFLLMQRNKQLSKSSSIKTSATEEITALATSDPDITWQIVVGSLAGVTPFVVAGIEFSKRIVKQRKCEVCGGSGLVLKNNKFYKRCPDCGGFLPWQSWRRFFTG